MNIKQLIYDKVVYPLFKDKIDPKKEWVEYIEGQLTKVANEKWALVDAIERNSAAEQLKVKLGFDPTESREGMIKAGLLVDGEPKGIVYSGPSLSKYLDKDIINASSLRTAPPYGGPDYSTSLKLRSDLNA